MSQKRQGVHISQELCLHDPNATKAEACNEIELVEDQVENI